MFSAKLWLTGPDKPGLLFRLSEVISEQKLNIEHLQTEQHKRCAIAERSAVRTRAALVRCRGHPSGDAIARVAIARRPDRASPARRGRACARAA